MCFKLGLVWKRGRLAAAAARLLIFIVSKSLQKRFLFARRAEATELVTHIEMAFWGVEVKSGKPVTLDYDSEKGRLHLTQATLGLGSSEKKSVVQCNVGDGPGILLCSLLPGKTEGCSLNLQFEEEEEVTFSVLGPCSVHLTGYYMPPNRESRHDSDTSGEDITGDSEDSDDFSNDDEYEEDFIDDDMIVSSGAHNSGVIIEEIEDEEPSKEHTKVTVKKKKKDEEQKEISPVNGAVGDSKSISDINKNESGQKLIEETNHISESEDGDGFPIRMKRKRTENNQAEPLPKDQAIEGNLGDATDPSKLTAPDVSKEGKLSKKKKKKLKKKGNKSETEGISGNANNGLLEEIEEMSVPSDKMKDEMERGNNVRTFPNGLVIEELSMGMPDGKKAAPGNKVSMYYTGKLKKNGKIFDSNIGRKPFKFRLGVGEVISGWDVGVKGMRVGDKRRLTIPPAMGYGAAGAGEIPGNAWLVFDVELVNVR